MASVEKQYQRLRDAFGKFKSQLEPEQTKFYHSTGDQFGLIKGEQLDEGARAAASLMLALGDVDPRPAPWLTKEAVKQRMARDDVKDALKNFGQWPFDD